MTKKKKSFPRTNQRKQDPTKLTPLQTEILNLFKTLGCMTDEQLLARAEVSYWGPSTVRSRRAELVQMRLVMPYGQSLNRRGHFMTVWGVRVIDTEEVKTT